MDAGLPSCTGLLGPEGAVQSGPFSRVAQAAEKLAVIGFKEKTVKGRCCLGGWAVRQRRCLALFFADAVVALPES